MVNALLLIPLLPFAGFLLNASFGRRATKSASGAVAVGDLIAPSMTPFHGGSKGRLRPWMPQV